MVQKNCTLQLIKKYMFNFERNLFKKRRVQFFAPLIFIHLSYWIKIVQHDLVLNTVLKRFNSRMLLLSFLFILHLAGLRNMREEIIKNRKWMGKKISFFNNYYKILIIFFNIYTIVKKIWKSLQLAQT